MSATTEANERELKCAGRKKTGPQLFLTTLLHMGTGLPCRTFGHWTKGTASERLPPGRDAAGFAATVVLVDLRMRASPATIFIDASLRQSRTLLLRVGSNVHLLRKLGYIQRESRDTVYLWPEKNWHEPPVVLRLIQRRQGKKALVLVTNVLDKRLVSEQSRDVVLRDALGRGGFPAARSNRRSKSGRC